MGYESNYSLHRFGFIAMLFVGFAALMVIIASIGFAFGADLTMFYIIGAVISAVVILGASRVFSINRSGTFQPWYEYTRPQAVLLMMIILCVTLVIGQLFISSMPPGWYYDEAGNTIMPTKTITRSTMLHAHILVISGVLASYGVRYCLHTPGYCGWTV